ncbi:MAG: pyrroline-5-carboxylate reductase [Clostridia bacterium]|nr:pyrroline-5-carboxylate reductase [Clostridia bacterium]
MQYTLGFIGCGNMGGALVASAVKSLPASEIAVCDYDQTKTENYAKNYGVAVLSAEEIVKTCRFVVLGVKPQALAQTLAPIADFLRARTDAVIITMAAGTPIANIRKLLNAEHFPIIRIMPNTPVALGEGMILYTLSEVDERNEQDFLRAFSKAGQFDEIDESILDAASALSGCGPAFAYHFAQALAKGAYEQGVPQDKADFYAAQILLGAAKMLMEYKNPADLKTAVCSPGGTTLAGLKAMEENGFSDATVAGVTAAYHRALELQK